MRALSRWIFGLAATVLVTTISYWWLDRPLALIFDKTFPYTRAFVTLTHLPDPLVPFAIVVFIGLGLWSLSGRPLSHLQKCALLSSISLIVAEATKAQLKFLFGRTWPATWVNNNPSFLHDGVYGFNFFHGGPEYASFPSGHMAVTCAVLSILWIYYPTMRTLWMIAGLAAATGLIAANYHFLSDVIAGSFVGISSGLMVASLWNADVHFGARK
jgi:membrane-associated phospholipid phosphatase